MILGMGKETTEVTLAWAEFASREDEVAFRLRHRSVTGRLTVFAVAAISVFILLNIPNDVLFATSRGELAFQIGLRSVNVLLGVGVACLALRSPDPLRIERATLAWLAFTIAGKFVVLALRPPDYHGHIPGDLVFLLIALLILPVSFRAQLVATATLALADLSIALAFRDPLPHSSALSALLSYAMAIALGGFATHRTQTVLRREFALLRRESAMRESLANALAEVRTLRGIVPICASCHNIRDDAGFWHRVEVYVHAHTHADFTHGICPSCVRKLYPELADAALQENAEPRPPEP